VKEIEHYAKQTGVIFSRLAFSRLVKEISAYYMKNIKFQASALAALQESAEAMLVMLFEMRYISIYA